MIEWLTTPVPLWVVWLAAFTNAFVARAWADVKAWRKTRKTRKAPRTHFHSLGPGVRFPCDDTRCPESRTP